MKTSNVPELVAEWESKEAEQEAKERKEEEERRKRIAKETFTEHSPRSGYGWTEGISSRMHIWAEWFRTKANQIAYQGHTLKVCILSSASISKPNEIVTQIKEAENLELQTRFEALRQIESILAETAKEYYGTYIFERAKKMVTSNELETIEKKQEFCKTINKDLRRYDLEILNPQTNAPCVIFAINDGKSGRFVFEDRATKKRSCTNKSILDMMPFRIASLANDSPPKKGEKK